MSGKTPDLPKAQTTEHVSTKCMGLENICRSEPTPAERSSTRIKHLQNVRRLEPHSYATCKDQNHTPNQRQKTWITHLHNVHGQEQYTHRTPKDQNYTPTQCLRIRITHRHNVKGPEPHTYTKVEDPNHTPTELPRSMERTRSLDGKRYRPVSLVVTLRVENRMEQEKGWNDLLTKWEMEK